MPEFALIIILIYSFIIWIPVKIIFFCVFFAICARKTCLKQDVIVWKLLLLRENFILGLTPSLKTSGMPFFILPCGRSLSVIRLVVCRKNDKLYLKFALCVKIVIEKFFFRRIQMVAGFLFRIFVFWKWIFRFVCCCLSLVLCPWSNPSLCEICRRCVKSDNDMESLPTEELSFVRRDKSWTLKWSSVLVAMTGEVLRLEKWKSYMLLK